MDRIQATFATVAAASNLSVFGAANDMCMYCGGPTLNGLCMICGRSRSRRASPRPQHEADLTGKPRSPGNPPGKSRAKVSDSDLQQKHKGPVSGAFEVAGAGFEPATSGL